jgi:hypothetical protein
MKKTLIFWFCAGLVGTASSKVWDDTPFNLHQDAIDFKVELIGKDKLKLPEGPQVQAGIGLLHLNYNESK